MLDPRWTHAESPEAELVHVEAGRIRRRGWAGRCVGCLRVQLRILVRPRLHGLVIKGPAFRGVITECSRCVDAFVDRRVKRPQVAVPT